MYRAIDFAVLIFASMAGIGSLIRVFQNQRYWRWVNERHREKKKKKNA